MKKYAVIVGGGTGSRMGGATPKQFLLLDDNTILWHSIHKFSSAYEDLEIILVLPEDWLDRGREIVEKMNLRQAVSICSGGKTRFHSVQRGLAKVMEESIVFVHDAVRCLVSVSLIHRCYEAALERGSAIPVIDAKDSVRLIESDGSRPLDRHRVKLVQTPQTFKSDILIPAYQRPYQEHFTDEATVVEDMGIPVSLVQGDEQNIKVTMPDDLVIAKQYLSGHK